MSRSPPSALSIATILDGDRLAPIHRFKTHFSLHGGPMHDYRMGEAVARVQGAFPVRRVRLDDDLHDFFFTLLLFHGTLLSLIIDTWSANEQGEDFLRYQLASVKELVALLLDQQIAAGTTIVLRAHYDFELQKGGFWMAEISTGFGLS